MTDARASGALLALLVVLAGCSTVGPERTTQSPSQTEPEVTVAGDLPFDAETVYRRVADLHGIPYASLPDVTVEVKDQADLDVSDLTSVTRFQRTMGFDPETPDTALAGLARPGRVSLFTDPVDTHEQLEQVLAHEFAHIVQFDQDAYDEVDDAIRGSGGNETRLQTAATEGAASYVAEQYAVEYLDADPGLRPWAEVRANRSQFGAYVVAPYHFGQRYVQQRVDSPADLPAVYDDPPRSSEQLISGDDADRPKQLFVRFDGLDRPVADRRTKGELFVRLMLEGQLDGDRAATAAAGWGRDRLLPLDDGDGTRSYVWALRWDTPEDADEFEAAMRDFLDGHAGAPGDGPWRDGETAYQVQRAGEETVVVFVGDPAFVTNVSATAGGGEVTVSADSETLVTASDARTVPRRPVRP